jgi:hypothetical protein
MVADQAVSIGSTSGPHRLRPEPGHRGFHYQATSGDAYAIPINLATTVAKQIEAGKHPTLST